MPGQQPVSVAIAVQAWLSCFGVQAYSYRATSSACTQQQLPTCLQAGGGLTFEYQEGEFSCQLLHGSNSDLNAALS